jgi:N-acetylglucosaminyl-diphospho-decaprenol L-rhamnosyltransferase
MDSSPTPPVISIIIPNLNGEKLLPQCLEALKLSIDRYRERSEAISSTSDVEVALIDNGSADRSIEVARSILPDVRVISLGKNQGFAGAVRRGIEASRGEYIALLNNDAVPEASWLHALLHAAKADNQIGMVASRILNRDGIAIDSLGLAPARNGMAVLIGHGQSLESPPRYPGGNQRGGAITEEPFGPSGAAALYRRDMLDQFGGFPERFFCYYEDLWVAWQGRLRGWKCVLADDAVVRHLGQGTPFTGWKNRSYWITLNKWRTIFSCWHPMLVAKHFPSITYWDALAKAGRIFSGEFRQAVSARVKAFSEIGYWTKLRKSAYANSAISAAECDSWLISPPRLSEIVGRKVR